MRMDPLLIIARSAFGTISPAHRLDNHRGEIGRLSAGLPDLGNLRGVRHFGTRLFGRDRRGPSGPRTQCPSSSGRASPYVRPPYLGFLRCLDDGYESRLDLKMAGHDIVIQAMDVDGTRIGIGLGDWRLVARCRHDIIAMLMLMSAEDEVDLLDLPGQSLSSSIERCVRAMSTSYCPPVRADLRGPTQQRVAADVIGVSVRIGGQSK